MCVWCKINSYHWPSCHIKYLPAHEAQYQLLTGTQCGNNIPLIFHAGTIGTADTAAHVACVMYPLLGHNTCTCTCIYMIHVHVHDCDIDSIELVQDGQAIISKFCQLRIHI